MASLESTVQVQFNEYRPCIVDGIGKALFHRWEVFSKPLPASPLIGGEPAGVLSYTVGIIEDSNGQVKRVEPTSIRFTGNKIHNYYFGESQDKKENPNPNYKTPIGRRIDNAK